MEHIRTGRTVGPEHFAVALVDAEKTGGFGIRQVDVPLVHAVARVDEEQVARGCHAAGAHVVLRHTQLLHHVEHPDHVGFVVGRLLLGGERPVVLAVTEALGVEALHLAAAGDVPQPVALHERCTADALQGPVVHAAGGQLLAGILPEERSVLAVEGE